jgi:transcriptional regulator with XRE-family HTH domain
MGHRKWRDLLAEQEAKEPGYIARIEEGSRRLRAEYDAYQRRLPEVLKARELTLAELARRLDVGQGEVRRLEGLADLYLTTLAEYVCSLGGELKLVTVFDGQEVPFELGGLTDRPANVSPIEWAEREPQEESESVD